MMSSIAPVPPNRRSLAMLWDLDIDVMTRIFALLDVKGILSLRLTSKHFNALTRLRIVWYDALVYHVLSQNIFIPRIFRTRKSGRDMPVNFSQQGLESLSAEDLERAARTALIAYRNWQSEEPVRVRERTVRKRKNIKKLKSLVQFLRIRTAATDEDEEEGRYLLAFDNGPVHLRLLVWDAESTDKDAKDGIRLVEKWKAEGCNGVMAVDEGNGIRELASSAGSPDAKGALIAISFHHRVANQTDETTTLYKLHILRFTPHSSSGPYPSFHDVKVFDTERPLYLRALCGRFIVVQIEEVDRSKTLKVVDWVRSTVIFTDSPRDARGDHDLNGQVEISVELVSSTDKDYVSHVHFVHDWVLVFRGSVLELYFVPPSALRLYSAENGDCVPVLRPAMVHEYMKNIGPRKIAWSAVTERVSWASERAATRCITCNGQGYVDGEDIMLQPAAQGEDKSKHKRRDEDEMMRRVVCTCRYRPLSLAVLIGTRDQGEWQLQHRVLHIPDGTAPVLVHAFQLNNTHACRVLALGRFGTLFSIDEASHAWNSEGEDVDIKEKMAFSPYNDYNTDRATGRYLPLRSQFEHITPPHGPLEPDDEPEPVDDLFLPVESRVTMSVFEWRKWEMWCTVALCERARRIVLGHSTGLIELWDYI